MSANHLDSVVLQKEKEWREASQLRVQALEETIAEKDRELRQEKLRFRKLKDDFEYNLKLILERDQELEKYDAVIGKVKEDEHVKTAQVSELCVKIDELNIKLQNEQKSKEELQKHYQKRLQEYQNQFKAFHEEKDNEVAKEREELSSYRKNLEQQLRETENDFEFRHQENVTNFDEAIRKKEQEYRSKLDETSSLLLSNDLKIRSLTKELELLRCDSRRCKEELDKTGVSTRELERMLKEKDWMISDLENTHKYKVTDLEAQLENMRKMGDNLEEDFKRKHAELDRYAREKEVMLTNAKQGFTEKERQLQQNIRKLQNQLEAKEQEHRQKEWRLVDKLKENDITIQTLNQSIADLKSKMDQQNQEYSRLTVAKDVELETLHQQESKMRSELAQRKNDLDRRQKELSLSLERESSLERSRAQLELDWQRRCEEAERTGYDKQEKLVKNLTQGKEEALSLVKQQKRELLHKDSVIHILKTQSDESVSILKLHGLTVPSQISVEDVGTPAANMNNEELQVQNENLRHVIHQMRQDMEDLTKQLTQRTTGSITNAGDGVPITEEYVRSLEKEIREVKARNHELTQSTVNTNAKTENTEPTYVLDGSKDNVHIRGLVAQLNSTIGSLRQEKLDLTSQWRKCEATIVHLQGLLHHSSEEVRQKQLNIDQLHYQLTTENRRANEEINALKQQNSDLKLQVTQARHQADEFYKTGLERNIDAVSLGNQLSALKLDLASHGKPLNTYNPESQFIQDLRQNEVPGMKGVVSSSEGLHTKLRQAAQRINGLTKEREQLIKMGNKLRAELLKYKGGRKSPSIEASQLSKDPQNVAQTSRFQLRGLEQLQYQLTSKELQYAQKTLARNNDQHSLSPRKKNSASAQTLQKHSPNTELAENAGLPETSTGRDDIVSPWQPSFSSDDRASLQDVWKLLDEDSPGFTPRGNRGGEVSKSQLRESSSTTDSFTVKGQPSHVHLKPECSKAALSAKAAGKWTPSQVKAKIRNYNIRDEDVREGL
ncbi:coiled-coil domain-containing protein 57-like [Dendronephthya gigantea]|uniref:coiled-coil domain-containing protein 57-like n=1 Tax=Dendronephthya gigantea TaxID=151771 RepID=UPI00106915B3|nr:coiled-coil domain-containing protein 57-like [Dendronephthya gigantea]